MRRSRWSETLMRTMLVTIILGTLLLGSVTLAEEQRAKTTITGWPPYTFGADLATVLQANSNLKRGCVMNGRRTEESAGWLCVQGNVDAPIGGQSHTATLSLEFNQDRLEVMILMWNFDSATSRRMAGDRLELELQANYAAELWGGNEPPIPFLMFLAYALNRPLEMPAHMSFWHDAQSNALFMVDAWGQLSLMYISAKEVRDIGRSLP